MRKQRLRARQLHHFQRLADALRLLRPLHAPAMGQRQPQVLAHRQPAQQARSLKHHCAILRPRQHLACIRRQQTGRHAQQRGLAAARSPQQAIDGASFQRQRGIAQHRPPAQAQAHALKHTLKCGPESGPECGPECGNRRFAHAATSGKRRPSKAAAAR